MFNLKIIKVHKLTYLIISHKNKRSIRIIGYLAMEIDNDTESVQDSECTSTPILSDEDWAKLSGAAEKIQGETSNMNNMTLSLLKRIRSGELETENVS